MPPYDLFSTAGKGFRQCVESSHREVSSATVCWALMRRLVVNQVGGSGRTGLGFGLGPQGMSIR